MTSRPLSDLLESDHARLRELLRRAAADGATIDAGPYEAFRAGLLRHIAMEEKVLLPEIRRRRGGEPPEVAKQLRADHAALAALLVPTPTHAILATIGGVLAEHDPLEEGPAGLYPLAEALLAPERDAILERLKAVPAVPLAAHFDGPRAFASIENLLRARTAPCAAIAPGSAP
jgi:hypothetical protein